MPLVKRVTKLFFLFLNQNICCWYSNSKNRLNETVLLSTENIMLKLMGKKIFIILRSEIVDQTCVK